MGGGGGGSTSGPIYEKREGDSPLQVRYTKSVWGGGGGGQFADTFVWHTENTLSLIINGYNFDRGGCSSTRSEYATGLKKLYIHVHVPTTYYLGILHTRARMNLKLSFLIVFIL